MSNPIVLTCPTDASSSGRSTPPWHADAVRGRPSHHSRSRSKLARPYICRLISLSRVIWPSAWLLLLRHGERGTDRGTVPAPSQTRVGALPIVAIGGE